ncbi:uncharacterized protein CFAP92-like [Eublepharis macularius]|uniref:Uncharacterized protein CFAP92-like n=1 Tax=Eublepharis macularius TaxID=481883 RepID=A0AA97J5I3_EUBMA|nr:uncharacterized protein CFAP92-like [Eublepharis macularius]
MPPYYPRNNPERMARKTSADGVHGQMEEEKKQEDHQTTPEKALEKERDLNTLGSESTDGIDSPWADAGGHPTPEDESRPTNESEKSQEFESEHLVTCIFTVSLAVPLNLPRTKSWISSRQDVPRTASKMREGLIPKMHRFYHMEYFLLPDDTEPRKLDLVLFGPTAKLFLDSESKSGTPKENERPRSKKQSTLHTSVVKPWLENDQIWVSWNHSIEINVTNDFLVKLRDHKIKLRLWDNKEKMCAKAKFCKPKASHLDQPDVDSKFIVRTKITKYLINSV